MEDFDILIEALTNGAPEDEVTDILNENKFDEEHRETQSYYLLLFEQYIDECSAYSFKGWDDLKVYGEPKIEKFWFEVKLLAPDNIDYESGIKRILGQYKQNKAVMKTINNGSKIIKIRILRSILDELEDRNRKLARKEAEDQGYAPQEEPPQDNQQGGDEFGGDEFGQESF
jgi:hypothetical protein